MYDKITHFYNNYFKNHINDYFLLNDYVKL